MSHARKYGNQQVTALIFSLQLPTRPNIWPSTTHLCQHLTTAAEQCHAAHAPTTHARHAHRTRDAVGVFPQEDVPVEADSPPPIVGAWAGMQA